MLFRSINLILSGTISYTSEGQTLALNEARSLFFSPGAGYHYAITDHLNAVVLEIDLGRLKRTAAAIAGIGISPRRFNGDLDHLRALQPRSSARSRQLLNVLTSAFRMLDHPELEALGSLQHLQLDDLIYRNLALLLCPQLEVICRQTSEQRSCREQVFEDLLEWIRANLHQPIKLSQLEQQSGYSRRSLQLAFQQRYDCGPIQWVRQQRLEQARQALLQADPDESVAGVGARFGFSSLAVFSRVFRQQFGLTPSQVLREGNLRRP